MQTNIFDYLRIALYGIIIFMLVTLYQMWEKEHPKKINHPTPVENLSNNYVPEITSNQQKVDTIQPNTTVSPPSPMEIKQRFVHITTDLLQVDIDTLGGNIVQLKLRDYPEELHSNQPFLLLNDQSNTQYIAQSGLLSNVGPDTSQEQAKYSIQQTEYSLMDNQQNLDVKLSWTNDQGLTVYKIFSFKRNSYEIDVDYQIINHSNQPWNGNLYLQLMRKDTPPADEQSFINLATYFGAAISSQEKHFQKISFKDMRKQNLNQTITGGWASMIQHYFVSAWIPNQNLTSQYFSRVTPDGLYTIGIINPKIEANPGQTVNTKASFYAGPAIADLLEKAAPSLKLTIDYGWFWFISAILFWMMQQIYNVIGNWGWSIVILTLVIKLLFYHLSSKSYRSMSALKKLQPKIAALKERFGDDKQKFTQATLELYKKEKVNPMSGCLPILIQIPVFIGLYWVLIESVQLRHAPFVLWIHDLSTKDPYYILPILMGLSMFLQQRLSPPPPDPIQAKVMMLMPVIFTVLFINFPAGLMLYWFVNNTLSYMQQWYIMRSVEKAEKKQK